MQAAGRFVTSGDSDVGAGEMAAVAMTQWLEIYFTDLKWVTHFKSATE